MSLLLLFRGGALPTQTNPGFSGQAEGQRTFLHHPTTSNVPMDMPTLIDVFIGDTAEIEYFFEEMRRRTLTIVLNQGEDVVVLPRKKQGTRCTFWKAEEEQCERPLDPRSTCYNTGWIGGYHDPILMKFVIPPTKRTSVYYQEGVRKEFQPRPWTMHLPRLNERDLVVRRFSGQRLEVLNVNEVRFRGQVMKQEFDLRQAPPEKETYLLAVPVPPPNSR